MMRSPQVCMCKVAIGVPDGLREAGAGVEKQAQLAEEIFAQLFIGAQGAEKIFVAFGDVEIDGG